MEDAGKTPKWADLFEASLPPHCPLMHNLLKEWHTHGDDRAKVIWDNLSKFTGLEGKTLLDFGCGEGVLSIYFAKHKMQVTGVDITADQIFRTKLRAAENQVALETYLINEDGRLPGLKDEQFDVILCHTVIEHCVKPEVTISELRRLAKKSGLIYLTTCNRIGLGWLLADAHYQLPLVSILPKPYGDYMV
jgi:ubiquinone biosynthesis O-methyltransferase